MNALPAKPLVADLSFSGEHDSEEASIGRLSAKGKFLFHGSKKVYVRGVTYGPFRPDHEGCEYPSQETVTQDFVQMRRHGVNAVRVYCVPPQWFLDLAQENSLHVLVGLAWEQHVTFLSGGRARDIQRRVMAGARECSGHPAVLGYAIGNEIPAPLVRWYGHRAVEKFLERLYWGVKDQDPDSLVTYVNYPSTEYLELPFLDFVAFNVYLESRQRLQAYLDRLQNIAGDRPLLMGEIGMDSLRAGVALQAQMLGSQGEKVFEAGCVGLFYFAWTDEWHRGGQDITDWKFGLTTTDRQPKPALASATTVFQQVPFGTGKDWPFISVVVCTYNGGRTLRSCLEGLDRQKYPRFEVIVVIDGSTDNSAAIAAEFDVRRISIPNGGLSNARNVGWQAAQGEIVAYLDDDAAPDEHWLVYLALGLRVGSNAGVGGPNVAWPNCGWLADCVEHAPGNPALVLLTDREAEHLPGCNMAFRKECLAAVGGFDTQFRIAGDDVDVCWRLQQRGWKLGFHPTAMVWHRRRSTLWGYWKQQLNYGKAEAMLERKWPEKYNAVGHATWSGRLYSKGIFSWLTCSQRRIYHGTWGSALFQSLDSPEPRRLASILMLPEWYLVLVLLALISACGVIYPPLRYALAILGLFLVPPLAQAVLSGARAALQRSPHLRLRDLRLAAGTAGLHFLQPAARLWGRLCYGLTPWRRRGSGKLVVPKPQAIDLWSQGQWQSAEQRLKAIEEALRTMGAPVLRGGAYDRWDLEVRGGLLGTARLLMVIEEHGQGRQYVRMRLWPMAPPATFIVACLFAVLASVAALDLRWTAWALLNVPAIFLMARTCYECAAAMAVIRQAISPNQDSSPKTEPDLCIHPGRS